MMIEELRAIAGWAVTLEALAGFTVAAVTSRIMYRRGYKDAEARALAAEAMVREDQLEHVRSMTALVDAAGGSIIVTALTTSRLHRMKLTISPLRGGDAVEYRRHIEGRGY